MEKYSYIGSDGTDGSRKGLPIAYGETVCLLLPVLFFSTAVDVSTASTNPSNRLNGNGIIRITSAGTIIPQIQFITSAPTNGTRMTGSYIIFTLLNTNNSNSFGDWV
jgi:hypothetical protein